MSKKFIPVLFVLLLLAGCSANKDLPQDTENFFSSVSNTSEILQDETLPDEPISAITDCNSIKYVLIKQTDDNLKIAQAIKEAFRKRHIFFSTDDEKDIEMLRRRFKAWRKTK